MNDDTLSDTQQPDLLNVRSGFANDTEFVRITADGEVFINWNLTAELLSAPEDKQVLVVSVARLMVAIRDNTYRTVSPSSGRIQ